MLRILGNRKRLCNGLSRRELLTAGGLSLFGLGLHDFFRLRDARATTTAPVATPGRFGQAPIVLMNSGTLAIARAKAKPISALIAQAAAAARSRNSPRSSNGSRARRSAQIKAASSASAATTSGRA